MAIIKNNIDNWLAIVEQQKIEAICMTASGCGVAIKEYSQLLASDKDYANKAKRISELYKEPAEIIADIIESDPQALTRLTENSHRKKQSIAFHPPCTLQHGMQHKNLIEPILQKAGFTLLPFNEAHLCCGSAGTYSITQKKLSQQLLANKLGNIEKVEPEIIATANIGCHLHLQSGTETPVKHWLELLL